MFTWVRERGRKKVTDRSGVTKPGARGGRDKEEGAKRQQYVMGQNLDSCFRRTFNSHELATAHEGSRLTISPGKPLEGE